MMRGEHPQDYQCSSDLFPNGNLEDYLYADEKGIIKLLLKQDTNHSRHTVKKIKLHCELLNLDFDKFIRQFSHSYWEQISGDNRVVCADSAIKERYHILSLGPVSYDIVENDNIRQMTDRSYNSIDLSEANGLINMYEEIRNILGSKHCYIVETLSSRNHQSETYDHFAVQVHRGVDTQEVDFIAEPKGWPNIEFNCVRGATKSEIGEEILLTLSYPEEFRFNPKLINETASIQANEHYVSRVFSEIMFRKRKLQIFPFRDYSDIRYELTNHCSRNSLFKPNCSVLAYSPDIMQHFGKQMRKDELIQIKANFVSDGNRAYLNL